MNFILGAPHEGPDGDVWFEVCTTIFQSFTLIVRNKFSLFKSWTLTLYFNSLLNFSYSLVVLYYVINIFHFSELLLSVSCGGPSLSGSSSEGGRVLLRSLICSVAPAWCILFCNYWFLPRSPGLFYRCLPYFNT